jgi:hypothetical protein
MINNRWSELNVHASHALVDRTGMAVRADTAGGPRIGVVSAASGPRDAIRELTLHREYWVLAREENVYVLGRFARQINVGIRNLCPHQDPVILVRRVPIGPRRISSQREEGWTVISARQDGKPDEVIHDFSLEV